MQQDRFHAARPFSRPSPDDSSLALRPHDAIEFQRTVLADRGYLLLLRRLLLRARRHIDRQALQARIDGRPIDGSGEAIIIDIDTALTEDRAHVTFGD
jgi:hypothetical protein